MNTPTILPLRGVRILDLTTIPPGAFCTSMLADLGAEVVCVERQGAKDRSFALQGKVSLTKGKRSITLDLKHPSAAKVLRKLAAASDVVIENASPGTMSARGIGYDELRADNPGLIWCSITSFGQDGPYAGYPGHDISFMAHSGMLAALGRELPWHPAMIVAVPIGGMMAAMGIQSALIERANSGVGAQIDISLSEGATWIVSGAIGDLTAEPEPVLAAPDRRLYRCADGEFVAVAAAEPRTWAALCNGLGVPELLDTLHVPAKAEAATAKLAAIFSTKPAREWVEQLAPSGASVISVNHGRQIVDDPQVVARQSVIAVGDARVAANPIRMRSPDGRRSTSATALPAAIGEDTVDVLTSAGFSDEEITELRDSAAI